jgi:hypothetical protein
VIDDDNQPPANLPGRRRAHPLVPPIKEHVEPAGLHADAPPFEQVELAKVRAQIGRDRLVAGLTGLVMLGAGAFVVTGHLDAGTCLGVFGVFTGGYFRRSRS